MPPTQDDLQKRATARQRAVPIKDISASQTQRFRPLQADFPDSFLERHSRRPATHQHLVGEGDQTIPPRQAYALGHPLRWETISEW